MRCPGTSLNLETLRVISKPRFGRTIWVDERGLSEILNGGTKSWEGIAQVSEYDVFSTFRPTGSEPPGVEDDGLACSRTDVGIDAHTDGHLILNGERDGLDYARRKRAVVIRDTPTEASLVLWRMLHCKQPASLSCPVRDGLFRRPNHKWGELRRIGLPSLPLPSAYPRKEPHVH